MQRGRLVFLLAVVGVLASGVVLLASPAAPPEGTQQSSRRSLELLVPRNLPIKIRLTPEKEQSFTDLKNENWIHDFELEVKNTGTKPIYYLRFTLNPDLSTPRGERSIGLMVQYGRAELFYRDEPSIPEDIPIQPNQTVVLKVFEDEAKGWDLWVKAQHLSGEKSKPQKSMLLFEMLNFGDGTGYISSEEEPFSVPKRDKPRPSYKQNPRTSELRASSLCNLCVLCVSVVKKTEQTLTTETQRTQRLHGEIQLKTLSGSARS